MPLVNAKCTNCGANLEVDSAKDAANCPYCGAAYIVEKAINNYSITNNTTNNTTNNINAEVVNVYGGIAEEFEISGGVLKKYNGSSLDIIIPDSVKRIGNNVFRDMAITSVQILEGVDSIGENAFSGCTGLQSVSIPGSVKRIGNEAFFGCFNLREVSIAEGVGSIGQSAFEYCRNLRTINLPQSIAGIGNSAFAACAGLQRLEIPGSVEIVGDYAFSGCTGLQSVSIPGSVEIVGDYAFSGCTGLQSVSIPGSVKIVGDYAFSRCTGLQSVPFLSGVRKIGSRVFDGCGITEIILPEGLQEIADYAFYESEIAYIGIPQTVTSIGRQAFFKCQNLKEITLPERLTSIGAEAFRYSGLSSIVIPQNVQVIEELAFDHCDSLEEITVLGNPELKRDRLANSDDYGWWGYPFNNCEQLKNVNASEEWKKANRYKILCLKNYRPTGSTQSQGSCYIATAVYGSYDCPQVWTLRRYRDNYLAESVPGRLFIRSYYAISPTIVRWFKDKDWFQRFWRDKLDKKVYKLNQKGYKDTPYSDK